MLRGGEGESVKPLELFDLVFVLALTQCTALMAEDPTWEGLARGLLVLAVLWWAWVGYAWLTSVIDPEEGPVFAVMAASLVCALRSGLWPSCPVTAGRTSSARRAGSWRPVTSQSATG